MESTDLSAFSHQFVLSLLQFQSSCLSLSFSHGDLKLGTRAFDVLFTLCRHPEEVLTMSQLAGCLQVSHPQLSKVVAPLEDQRLVRRRHDEMNRRLVYIAVTPAGRELVQAVTLEAARQFLPGLSALSPRERRRLEESLHTLDTLLHKAGCHTW